MTQYFYRNKSFTDNGLTNFGISIENIKTLSLISLDL